MPHTNDSHFIFAEKAAYVREKQIVRVNLDGHVIALCADGDRIFAVDNRCPHMGFPLDRGTIRNGILTCHWHHARFDMQSGGTFDLWADDVRAFPTEIRNGEVWVDLRPRRDPAEYQRQRLVEGLERNISLVVGKAAIHLIDSGGDPVEPFTTGLDFGVRNRNGGWGSGLTQHVCMMNLLPKLDPADRSRGMFHGLSAVAADTSGSPQRFEMQPLPDDTIDFATLKGWFRQFIEVRDGVGAERCIVSAIRSGADERQMADMLFSAATDHRYIDTGHPLDFTNKAFEALDVAGWDAADIVLTSLASGYASASRREESNAWRSPVDLVEVLSEGFLEIPDAVNEGRGKRGAWNGSDSLLPVLLGDDPHAIVKALLGALRDGATEVEIAGAVTVAAATRIRQFHTQNEFGDWDTALHTFTFANAVQQGLRRIGDLNTPEGWPLLLRGVFDAAMSVYLDRFLNIPAAKLGAPKPIDEPESALRELGDLLNRQQQVNEAGALVRDYLASGGDGGKLVATLGRLLLREDRNFHTIQCVEAATTQYAELGDTEAGHGMLVAAVRYLAAHAPTNRSQGQTYDIAWRLHRGEKVFEED